LGLPPFWAKKSVTDKKSVLPILVAALDKCVFQLNVVAEETFQMSNLIQICIPEKTTNAENFFGIIKNKSKPR